MTAQNELDAHWLEKFVGQRGNFEDEAATKLEGIVQRIRDLYGSTREVPAALLDKLVCDVDEIRRRVVDGPLFQVAEPGVELLYPNYSWSAQMSGANPTSGHRVDVRWRCLDTNRLELVLLLDGRSSRPFVFELAG